MQRWASQLAQMYMKWAKRQGYAGRIVERYPSDNGGLKSASIELEFKFAYGYLSGERGVHSLIRCSYKTSALPEVLFRRAHLLQDFANLLQNDLSMSKKSNTNAWLVMMHKIHKSLPVQSNTYVTLLLITCLVRFILPTFQASLASVDVIPLFIESSADLPINDEDLHVSYPSFGEENSQTSRASSAVRIQHIPTGVEVQSTGTSIKTTW